MLAVNFLHASCETESVTEQHKRVMITHQLLISYCTQNFMIINIIGLLFNFCAVMCTKSLVIRYFMIIMCS